jgi:hypothetical protein
MPCYKRRLSIIWSDEEDGPPSCTRKDEKTKGGKIDRLNFSWYHFNIYLYVLSVKRLSANKSSKPACVGAGNVLH